MISWDTKKLNWKNFLKSERKNKKILSSSMTKKAFSKHWKEKWRKNAWDWEIQQILGCFGRKTKSTKYALDALVLIAGFRAGLAVLNLGYPENSALKLRKPSWAMFINIILCWVLKNCELDLAGSAGFWKIIISV